MKLKRLIPVLFIGGAMFSCSDKKGTEPIPEGIPTYVNISISISDSRPNARSLPTDYNDDGTYEGNDVFERLDIYMKSSDGTIEAKRFEGREITNDGSGISPSQPFRTTSGKKTIYIVVNSPNPLGTSITEEDELIGTAGLARYKTVGGQDYDLIMMTGKSGLVDILPEVKMQDVIVLNSNKFDIDVTRTASRVIVTSSAPKEIVRDGVTIGAISELNYSIAQGTKQIYWLGQPGYITFGYDYVPALDNYIGQADQYYDYSTLSDKTAVPDLPLAGDGYKSMKGKFLFENTHLYGATRPETKYRKGNTAYVLVRAKFTPNQAAITDGGALSGGTFYVGSSDGHVYSSLAAASETNVNVAEYIGGWVLYYAWLNPDDIKTPLNSPVVRNNIYHINITGFKSLGQNWNPLFPEDPDSPSPQNPDPKPENPDEPDTPVNPEDHLTPEETYMTVRVTVLDWTAHSYNIDF